MKLRILLAAALICLIPLLALTACGKDKNAGPGKLPPQKLAAPDKTDAVDLPWPQATIDTFKDAFAEGEGIIKEEDLVNALAGIREMRKLLATHGQDAEKPMNALARKHGYRDHREFHVMNTRHTRHFAMVTTISRYAKTISDLATKPDLTEDKRNTMVGIFEKELKKSIADSKLTLADMALLKKHFEEWKSLSKQYK